MEKSDWKNLILSIGKFHIRKRSPVEVAKLILKAERAGFSRNEIAERCHLKDSSMLSKFTNLLKLPEDYWGLIDWPETGAPISMTAAEKVAQHDTEIQKIILDARLKYGFNKDEISFLGQRIKRSGKSPEECIKESLNRRNGPVILFGVLMGSYYEETIQICWNKTQYEKDEILALFFRTKYPEETIKVKSRNNGFTIITSKQELFQQLSRNQEELEKQINEFICKTK